MFSNKHTKSHQTATSLSQDLVRKHEHGLNGLGRNHSVSSTRLSRQTLQADLPVQVLQSALGRHDMLNLHMDSLLDNAVSHLLVHLNTHSGLGDIKNDSSASMVTLERHTLVNSSVGHNIDVVTYVIAAHVSRERNNSVVAESSHVTSTGTISVSVRHSL